MKHALVFPGQGSQAVGMGKALAEAFATAREVFEEVDETLGQRLTRLMFEGPAEDLTLTENAQPALMAVSVAVARVVAKDGGKPVADLADCVAGHSLGEYSALTAAGALTLADAARLLKRRGQAMQRAVPVGQGAMAAILGLDLDKVREIAEAAAGDDVCAAANDNADGQVVVSGDADAVGRAVELAKEAGAKRSMLLDVSAPFHCTLMEPAAEEMREALAPVALAAPAVPLIANVTAEPVSEPERIKALLVAQVTGTVRWRESVLAIRDRGVGSLVEMGTGKVLAGLTRRIDRDLAARSVATPDEIEAFLAD